jgi:hypothetical protein
MSAFQIFTIDSRTKVPEQIEFLTNSRELYISMDIAIRSLGNQLPQASYHLRTCRSFVHNFFSRIIPYRSYVLIFASGLPMLPDYFWLQQDSQSTWFPDCQIARKSCQDWRRPKSGKLNSNGFSKALFTLRFRWRGKQYWYMQLKFAGVEVLR